MPLHHASPQWLPCPPRLPTRPLLLWQGIELVNPSAPKDSKEGTETYFSKQAAFFKSSF